MTKIIISYSQDQGNGDDRQPDQRLEVVVSSSLSRDGADKRLQRVKEAIRYLEGRVKEFAQRDRFLSEEYKRDLQQWRNIEKDLLKKLEAADQ